MWKKRAERDEDQPDGRRKMTKAGKRDMMKRTGRTFARDPENRS
jgi:hypothetical protein